MARFVDYRCPDCNGVFRHLHHPSDEPPPDRCALCGAWVSDDEPLDELFVPKAPRIAKSAYAKSVNQVYRKMEESSIERAREAADMAGVPESDMSHLKITNMRDPSEMREGDTAAIMPSTAVAAQRLTTPTAKPGFQQYGGGVPDHAPGVGGYQQRNAVMTDIRSTHSQRASAMVRAGELGRHQEK